ncbi:MAG: CAP domain-containing protein [bacterium]
MSTVRHGLRGFVLAAVMISAVLPAAAGAQGSDAQSLQAADSSRYSRAAGSVVASRDGFELRSLDDSFSYGGQADYTLRVLPDGDFIKVQVQVFASEMKACLVELGFDERHWQLVDGERGQWPGGEQPLQLSVPELPGSLHHGAVLPRPQQAEGVTGTFELLEARFSPIGQYSSVKGVASPGSSASGLSASIGDYNADGQVNLADMLRVSEYFGQRAADFPPGTLTSVDGDGNGIIDINDIQLIGNHLLMVSGNSPEVSIAASTLSNDALSRNHWPTSQVDLDWLTNYYLTLPALDSQFSVYDDAEQQQYAAKVFDYTNEARTEKKHTPLKRVPWLDAVAQAQAKHMALNGYFEHDSPQGMTIFDRIEAPDGPEWWHAGENIAAGYRTPEQAHKSWMDSGGHRKNIRNENYRYMGVGAYYLPGSEYGWYWVQVFATYREDPLTHDWIDPGQGDPVITREQILQMQDQNPKQPASRAAAVDNTRQVPKQPVRRRG